MSAPTTHVWVASADAPTARGGSAAPAVVAGAAHDGAMARPRAGSTLSIAEARRYMAVLINRDRASIGLAPVELDEGAATQAGQRHADDMAKHAYLGHWGTDGSTPESRHTEAGGVDMVLENASCFTDERPRTLDPTPRIDPRDLETAESMFFNEVAPNDGHRRNILKPYHRRVGIGIAQPVATPTEVPVPCITQELTDAYGSYAPVPTKARVGDVVHVEGALIAPAVVVGVGLARVAAPSPIPVADANRRRSYPVPPPYQMYWPHGYVTPIPLQVTGSAFRIDLPLSDRGEPGLYELSVWAKIPGTKENVIVGLRSIVVARGK